MEAVTAMLKRLLSTPAPSPSAITNLVEELTELCPRVSTQPGAVFEWIPRILNLPRELHLQVVLLLHKEIMKLPRGPVERLISAAKPHISDLYLANMYSLLEESLQMLYGSSNNTGPNQDRFRIVGIDSNPQYQTVKSALLEQHRLSNSLPLFGWQTIRPVPAIPETVVLVSVPSIVVPTPMDTEKSHSVTETEPPVFVTPTKKRTRSAGDASQQSPPSTTAITPPSAKRRRRQPEGALHTTTFDPSMLGDDSLAARAHHIRERIVPLIVSGDTGGVEQTATNIAEEVVTLLRDVSLQSLHSEGTLTSDGKPPLAALCDWLDLKNICEEEFVAIVGQFVHGGDISYANGVAFIRCVLFPRVATLTRNAPRPLFNAIVSAVQRHPKAVVDGLLVPLTTSSSAADTSNVRIGAPQVEVVMRVVKEHLPPELAVGLLQGILYSGSNNSGSASQSLDVSLDDDFEALSQMSQRTSSQAPMTPSRAPSTPMSEGVLAIVGAILNQRGVVLSADVISRLVELLDVSADAFRRDAKFVLVVHTLVSRHGTQAAAHKESLRQVLARLEGPMAKAALKLLDKLQVAV